MSYTSDIIAGPRHRKTQLLLAFALIAFMFFLAYAERVRGSNLVEVSEHPATESYKLVPTHIRAKGNLVVGSEIDYPPYEFYAEDGKTAVGLDIDLLDAISGKLGLQFTVVNGTFSTYIPGLQSGRYDLTTAIADTVERRNVIGFVNYVLAGASITLPHSNPKNIAGLSDLCGLHVGYLKGTIQQNHVETQSEKCVIEGKSEISATVFPDTNILLLSLKSNRVDAVLQDFAPGVYANQQQGNLFKVLPPYVTYDFGFGFPKGEAQFKRAFKAALEEIREDGTYTSILEKWGLEAGSIDRFVVTGG